MKILYCIQATYNSGGMERILSLKANYLADILNYDVYIVTTDQNDKPNFYFFSPKIKFVDLNIGYSNINGSNLLKKILVRHKKILLHKKKLYDLLLTIKPDIVISMFGREVDFLWKYKDGSKKVLEFHFSRYVRIKRKQPLPWKIISLFNTYKDNIFARKYDKFVVLTKEDSNYWKKCPNCVCIPNPAINLRAQTSSCENKRIIAVGRLSYQKGYDTLLKIWYLIENKVPDWSLHIFGGGELELELKKQISKFKLQSVIIHKPTSNINKEYLSSSVFVLSSRYEGFPMVLLEAMSCGLPVVSFACKCGPRDIVKDGYNGFIVEEGNNRKFADKLLYIIQNESCRKAMGRNAKESVKLYNMDDIMAQWDTLFKSLF